MRRLIILCLAAFLVCSSCGCQAETPQNPEISQEAKRQPEPEPSHEPELSLEADLMESVFPVMDTVQHDTFDELLERCATEGVETAIRHFPVGDFEQLYYFTTYYHNDDNHNFPTSVIAFEESGVTYYFSGAEMWNPFASSSEDRAFGGNDTAHVVLEKDGDQVKTCSLSYNGYYDDFALSPVSPVDSQQYYETLTKVTGVQYKCVKSGAVSISEGIVYVTYISYDMSEGKYTLSEPDILSEISYNFEPPEQEFQDLSSDPDAPGGAMVTTPAYFYIEFDVIGSGRTVFSITGDDDEVLFSIEIQAGEDGAFLPNESF